MSDFPEKKYDVFLSHSHDDAEMVLELAKKLEDKAHLKVWLDKWELIPGDTFRHGMHEGLEQSKNCMVIIGGKMPDGWYDEEISSALNIEKSEKKAGKLYRVIPVLLPHGKKEYVTTFLENRTWVAFKTTIDDPNAFRRLVNAINDLKPGRDDERSKEKTKIKGALTLIPRPTTVIGREPQLKAIKEAFKNKKDIILVNGLGGIGKTTVALEYAWQQDDFDHVAWLEITDKIPEAFVNNVLLKNRLKVNELLTQISPQQLSTQGFELMLGTMNQLPGNNLLIVDNANNHEGLMAQMDYFQELNWKILFTSRIDSHLLDNDLYPIPIDELPLTDAVALFKTHFEFDESQQAVVEALVENLHRHTLLVELVARAGDKQKIALSELSELVQQEFIHHEKLNAEAIRTGKHAGRKEMPKIERITLYIQKFFQEITELTDKEKQYLRYFCLLPSNDYTKEELIDFFQVENNAKREFNDVLGELVKKGVVSFKVSEEENTYKLHALVQDVAVRELKPDTENCEVVIKTFIEKLWIDESRDNPVDKFKWISNGEKIVELIEVLAYGEIIELFYWLAFNYRHAGQYQKSRDLLERSLSFVKQHFGETHSKTSVFLNDLGWNYNLLGEYKEASRLLEQALNSDIKEFGRNHGRVTIRQSNLAIVYKNLGEHEKARDLLELSLASDLENYGKDHPKVANNRSNLANVYSNLGEHEKARDLLELSLVSDLENFGKDHPKVAIRRSNLANVYRLLGENEKSRDLLELSLASNLENFGKDHPEVAIIRSNLALVYEELKDYNKAQQLFKLAYESDLKNFGEKHPKVAIRQLNLGGLHYAMEDKATAKDYIQKSYTLFKELLGEDHPHTKTAKKWLEEVS